MPKVINCRICSGQREVIGSSCGGCGTPIANAEVKRKKSAKRNAGRTKPKCRACKRFNTRLHGDGQYLCIDCGAMFEGDDFSFVDDRPEHNAMKKGL